MKRGTSIKKTILEKYHRSKELALIATDKNLINDKEKQLIEYKTENQESENNHEQQQAEQIINKKNKFKKQKCKPSLRKEIKETKSENAVSYLKLWKQNRDQWKYKKNLNIWLMRNWKNRDKFPDQIFEIFLEYLHGQSVSNALNRMKKDAQSVIEHSETPELILNRARSILQWST